jgi:hypothetical protein
MPSRISSRLRKYMVETVLGLVSSTKPSKPCGTVRCTAPSTATLVGGDSGVAHSTSSFAHARADSPSGGVPLTVSISASVSSTLGTRPLATLAVGTSRQPQLGSTEGDASG